MADCPFVCVKQIGNFILTQWVFPPVKRHFDYWWCFDENIQGLKEGIRDLDRETLDVNQKLENARLHTETIRPGIEDWSKAGVEKLEEARKILLEDNIPKAWNFFSRYSMGRSAKIIADQIAAIRNDGNFNTVSDPAPPASMGSISHRPTVDIESRKQIEENIIESLKKSSIRMIVIYGMGGVGKTTMVERIRKRVKEESLFDEVVMVVVRQQPDMLKIQEEIAELLGLKFDVKSMSARAHKLHTRLMDKKRKLVIFDDVWKSLKLEDLGVPFEGVFERCKILLTSRLTGIFEGYKDKKVLELNVLKEEEAWILFKDKAGNCVEDAGLVSVAKDVVAECKGLPIALVTVGTALEDETDKSIWEDSLSQLRGSNPTDFPEVLAYVYKPLKLSYDYLESERERLLFLLCCLFPEDYNIPVEELTWYSMGLRMFDRFRNIQEARNRSLKLVKILKSRFLLMDGQDKDHVRIHDVVRDVGIFIGSKENDGFLQILEVNSVDSLSENSSRNSKWMSASISNEGIKVSLGLHFPNLHLLMMQLRLRYDVIPDVSFEGMEDINVLKFSMLSIESLTPTLRLQKSLRTLCLFNCGVKNISVIGELTSLEIFCCCECDNIMELPAEIGRLNRLRLLKLYKCYNLQRIPFGIISSLIRLEELKIRRSFSEWETRGARINAALTELVSLPNLTCLEIEIADWNSVPQDISLSPKLIKYSISIACYEYSTEKRDREKEINLNLWCDINVGKWIHLLVENTNALRLEGNGSNEFALSEIENLQSLRVSSCSTVKKLVKTKDCKFGTVFPMLEYLDLHELKNLDEIFDGKIPEVSSNLCKTPHQNVSLCNLKYIHIIYCFSLRYLFPTSIVTSLLQLEVLNIQSCEVMEQVFWNEIEGTTASIEFPKLQILTLKDLPNLTDFWEGVETIHFPKLAEIGIGYLPKLNSFTPLDSEPPHDGTCHHFLCNQKAKITGLKKLRLTKLGDDISNIWCHQIPINFFSTLVELSILSLNGIRNLMSSSMAKNLVSLKELFIKDCEEMVEVIDAEEEGVVDLSFFPALERLEIDELFKLRSFCQWKHPFELPSLKEVYIDWCPEMETFTLGLLSTQNINLLSIGGQEIDDKKDLNAVIHQFWIENHGKDDGDDQNDSDDQDSYSE